jgi:KaiC/GvpD/RAD55 family RecA-like ATPase
MTTLPRQSTGVPGLDPLLGGGLLPGTLTVLVGATGIGKTQFGVQFARAGLQDAPPPDRAPRAGIFFDMSVRGDSQSHVDYARRMFDWPLDCRTADATPELRDFFTRTNHGDHLHVFDHRGRRITRNDNDFDTWHEWQAQLNARMTAAIAFFYGNLVRGATRVVIDGIEPVDRPGDSIQFELFEYIYHQILRKDPEWVARDLFRQHYRDHADEAARSKYDPLRVGCLLLITSRETMLDELIGKPLDEGDVLSGANTIICLGKVRAGARVSRALHIVKHRGSAAAEEIVPFEINDRGLRVVAGAKS